MLYPDITSNLPTTKLSRLCLWNIGERQWGYLALDVSTAGDFITPFFFEVYYSITSQ